MSRHFILSDLHCPKCSGRMIYNSRGHECGAAGCDYWDFQPAPWLMRFWGPFCARQPYPVIQPECV